jgi:hypothetical protein
LYRGYLAVLRGESRAAEQALRATLGGESRQSSPARQALVALARLMSTTGRHAEALELCDAYAAGMQSDEVFGLERNGYLAVRARALGGVGRAEEARALMEEALSEAERYTVLLQFDRLIDAGMLGLLLQDERVLHGAARKAGHIARGSGMPGLMVRYATLEKAVQAAGQRLSAPPV